MNEFYLFIPVQERLTPETGSTAASFQGEQQGGSKP